MNENEYSGFGLNVRLQRTETASMLLWSGRSTWVDEEDSSFTLSSFLSNVVKDASSPTTFELHLEDLTLATSSTIGCIFNVVGSLLSGGHTVRICYSQGALFQMEFVGMVSNILKNRPEMQTRCELLSVASSENALPS